MASEDLAGDISRELAALQAAYDDADRALAERLGVGRTDLRCLDLVIREGPQTPGGIARRLRLARASVTALLVRLERAGYVWRRPDPDHGRRQIVAPTAALVSAIEPLVAPRVARGHDALAGYTDEQLALIRDFIRQTRSRHEHLTSELHRSTEPGHGDER
jgi:DNA-binding MarR family transcriptional regulator